MLPFAYVWIPPDVSERPAVSLQSQLLDRGFMVLPKSGSWFDLVNGLVEGLQVPPSLKQYLDDDKMGANRIRLYSMEPPLVYDNAGELSLGSLASSSRTVLDLEPDPLETLDNVITKTEQHTIPYALTTAEVNLPLLQVSLTPLYQTVLDAYGINSLTFAQLPKYVGELKLYEYPRDENLDILSSIIENRTTPNRPRVMSESEVLDIPLPGSVKKLFQDNDVIKLLIECQPESSLFCIIPKEDFSPVEEMIIENMKNDDIKYALQFLDCIGFLHSNNIVHLGLNLSSLKLHNGRLKLSGFHASEVVTDHETQWRRWDRRMAASALAFAAPELTAWSQGPVKPYHLDNYSAGQILYEMLMWDYRLFPRTLAEVETTFREAPTAHANDSLYQKRKVLKGLVCRMLTEERLEPVYVLQEFYCQFPREDA